VIPDLRPLGSGSEGDRPVVLVAQAAYHLAELRPLGQELAGRGVGTRIVAPVPPRRSFNRFRPAVRRHRQLIEAAATDDQPEPGLAIVDRAGALVVMNDWGTTRPLIERARALSIPVFAWVEGVQDFADTDTGQDRRPYRHVDHVFCLGPYDHAQLEGVERSTVGSRRLRALWQTAPQSPARPFVTVNSNFTYGIHTEHRRMWLASARRACRRADVAWTISRHVAERGLVPPWRVSPLPVDDLLARSTTLISRFSTLAYEALVRGVGLVYHNPHGELVPTFSEPEGAFEVTRSGDDLVAAIRRQPIDPAINRERAVPFLARHLRLEEGPEPAELAAETILRARRI
jgi:hypothetical protein